METFSIFRTNASDVSVEIRYFEWSFRLFLRNKSTIVLKKK